MSGKSKALEAIAYHEAGHAVAAFFLDLGIKYVTILPDENKGYLGCCYHRPAPEGFQPEIEMSLRERAWIERHIVCSYAGMFAEARLRGRKNWQGSGFDRRDAGNLGSYVAGHHPEALDAYLNWLWIRAAHFFDLDFRWTAVAAVASALLQKTTLSGQRVRQIVREALQRHADSHMGAARAEAELAREA